MAIPGISLADPGVVIKPKVVERANQVWFTAPANSTQTLTAVPLGDPAPNRIVVVTRVRYSSTATSEVTVGGVTLTMIPGSFPGVHIFYGLVPSGTTADVTVTNATGALYGEGSISVFTIHGAKSHVPVAYGSSNATPISIALSASGGDVLIASAYRYWSNRAGTPYAWSGASGTVVLNSEVGYDDVYHFYHSRFLVEDLAPGAFTLVGNPGTTSVRTAVAAVWR